MKKHALIIVFGIFVLIQPLSGQTWQSAKRLTWTTDDSDNQEIAVDSNNNIHVVWIEDASGDEEVYYKRSTDGGVSWTTKRLTYDPDGSAFPDIAVATNNHIHVVWQAYTLGNYEIYYKRSINGGAAWTTKRLTYTSGSSVSPAIATDSNNHIHVVWHEGVPGSYEIYYKKSTNGGTSWSTKRLTYNSGDSYSPAITVDSNNQIHVAWTDRTPGNWEIYYKKSTNGGATWTAKRLTYNSGSSSNPAIAAGSNNHIQVVWEDKTHGNTEIYYKKSTNGGGAWTTKRLSYNSGVSTGPDIAVDLNNNLHVAWMDYTPINAEIYNKRSTDGGASWTTTRLTWNSGQSYYPAIGVDSDNNIHVVWWDRTPGNSEIYYRKGIQ
jgi:hypothetical protein